jgi:hypothetical protein
MDEILLTEKQAYLAMFQFFENHYLRTHSDDLASLLGDMQINKYDGKPMDVALWKDWIECIQKTKNL